MAVGTQASTSSGIPTSWKVGAAVIGLLILVGYGGARGWWGTGPDPSEEDTDQERVQVTWTVLWGQMRLTGEVYEDTGKPKRDLLCDERDLRSRPLWTVSRRCTTSTTQTQATTSAARGAGIRRYRRVASCGCS